MADKVVSDVEETAVFAEYLGIPKRITGSGVRYYDTSLEERRAIAVACALDLIKAKVASGGTNVQYELNSLSDYADRIESALIK